MNCILKGLWLCSKIDGGSEKFIWQVYDKLLLSGKKNKKKNCLIYDFSD